MEMDILYNIKQILGRVLSHNDTACLFGSRARGEERSDSDWDILIIVDKDKLSDSDYNDISYPLRLYGWEIGETINPVLYTKKEWHQQRLTPFYHNVLADNKVIL